MIGCFKENISILYIRLMILIYFLAHNLSECLSTNEKNKKIYSSPSDQTEYNYLNQLIGFIFSQEIRIKPIRCIMPYQKMIQARRSKNKQKAYNRRYLSKQNCCFCCCSVMHYWLCRFLQSLRNCKSNSRRRSIQQQK
jgi:hypothetical protein